MYNKLKAILIGKYYRIKYNSYKKKCIREGQNEFIVFGTPFHGNLGDHAIIYAEEKFLNDINKNIFEIPTCFATYIFDYIKEKLPTSAYIFHTGGGFMGSHWFQEEELIRRVVSTFKNNKIIIFPQSIFYENTSFGKRELENSKIIYNSHQKLTICAREQKSFDFMKENYFNSKILFVPDIVLYLKKILTSKNRKNILFCFRNDKEKNINDKVIKKISDYLISKERTVKHTDTVIKKKVFKMERERLLYNKLNEFLSSELVITDRLHGMIFAYITNTPCIVFGNYNHKVEGVYQWIKESTYIRFINDLDNIKFIIDELLDKKNSAEEQISLDKEFIKLKEVILED